MKKKKEQQIVAIRPTPLQKEKVKLHFHPKSLVEMMTEYKALFDDEKGEDAQVVQWMLEDVLNVLKWALPRLRVKEEKVKIEKDESL